MHVSSIGELADAAEVAAAQTAVSRAEAGARRAEGKLLRARENAAGVAVTLLAVPLPLRGPPQPTRRRTIGAEEAAWLMDRRDFVAVERGTSPPRGTRSLISATRRPGYGAARRPPGTRGAGAGAADRPSAAPQRPGAASGGSATPGARRPARRQRAPASGRRSPPSVRGTRAFRRRRRVGSPAYGPTWWPARRTRPAVLRLGGRGRHGPPVLKLTRGGGRLRLGQRHAVASWTRRRRRQRRRSRRRTRRYPVRHRTGFGHRSAAIREPGLRARSRRLASLAGRGRHCRSARGRQLPEPRPVRAPAGPVVTARHIQPLQRDAGCFQP